MKVDPPGEGLVPYEREISRPLLACEETSEKALSYGPHSNIVAS